MLPSVPVSGHRRALPRLLLLALLSALAALFTPPPPPAAAQNTPLQLLVAAGYDGHVRADRWTPVLVTLTNPGPAVSGQLAVRTARNPGVGGTVTLPLEVGQGARLRATLLVTVRGGATGLVVEFLDDDNLVLAEQAVALRQLPPTDRLYAVVTTATIGALDLGGAVGAGRAATAVWTPEFVPPMGAALDPLDALVVSDVDSSTLTPAQRRAITDYVRGGGHLIVTGGPNWQPTAAGLDDLLPVAPERAVVAPALPDLARMAGVPATTLVGNSTLAVGALAPGARVLAQATSNDGTTVPLLVRRGYGLGTVDYLAADPQAGPLRGWAGTSTLVYGLVTSVAPRPSWSYGLSGWERAARASEIVPGFDLLPSIGPLLGFLALYIALVGPVNYLLLNALGRRELAWITIPACIAVFSVLAFVLGARLRGTQATLHRLSVVESSTDAPDARAQMLVGLLSPQRTAYTLEAAPGALLRPLPSAGLAAVGLLGAGPTAATVTQQTTFRAVDFIVDASFVASFVAQHTITAPPLSGQATLTVDPQAGVPAQQRVRGSLHNDSDLPLTEAVLLARGITQRLPNPIAPGQVVPFELVLAGEGPPAPAPLADRALTASVSTFAYSFAGPGANDPLRAIADILGQARAFAPTSRARSTLDATTTQDEQRRQAFLESFIYDPYVSTGRGSDIYVAGWLAQAPFEVGLADQGWNSEDLTLHLLQIVPERAPATPGARVLVSGDQFTWALDEVVNLAATAAPINLRLQDGAAVVFRYTPLPGAVLATVDELTILIDHSAGTRATLPLALWHWDEQRWERFEARGDQFTLRGASARPYIGPHNAVRVRLDGADTGFLNLGRLRVQHRGPF